MKISLNNNNYKFKKSTPSNIKNDNFKTLASFKIWNESPFKAQDVQGRAYVNLSKINFCSSLNHTLFQEDEICEELKESTVERLSKLPLQQKKEALALYAQGNITEGKLIDIVTIKDEEIKAYALELIKQGINAEVIVDINEGILDEESRASSEEYITLHRERILKIYNDISRFLDKGYKGDYISTLLIMEIKLDEQNLDKLTRFTNKMQSKIEFAKENILNIGFELDNILELVPEAFDRLISLIDEDMLNLNLILNMAADEESYNKGKKLLQEGYDEFDAEYLLDEDEESIRQIEELMDKYSLLSNRAKQLLKYRGEEFEKALKILKVTYRVKEELFALPDDLFNRVIHYIEISGDEEVLKELSHCISNKISGCDIDYSNLVRFLDEKEKELEAKNSKWIDFIETKLQDKNLLSELDEKDINFLKENLFENRFYTPEEYLTQFVHLKNLKTPTGENILGCESFGNKVKENGLGDFAAQRDDMLYNNIATILSLDSNSIERKYLDKILHLIQAGKINSSALRKLSSLNDLKSFESIYLGFDFCSKKSDSTWTIASNLKSDIDFVFDGGITQENWIDKYISTYKNEQEGISKSNIGDALVVEGEKFIRIKTKENKSKTIKLTKETYAKLFPPIERFLTTQQVMGNCYCIETLMSMYCNNASRDELLQMMEEDENGDITIRIGKYNPVVFKDGKLPQSEQPEIYSSGADGYKLFEYAYSCALVEDKVKYAKDNLSGEKLLEFERFIDENPNDFYIYEENNEIKWMKYSDFKKQDKNSPQRFLRCTYNSYNNYLLGNGGMQNEVYKKIGHTSSLYIGGMALEQIPKNKLKEQYNSQGIVCDNISTLEKAKKLINSPEFLDTHQVQIGLGSHAYNLTKETDENGESLFYLYNPHNQGFPIKFKDLQELFSKVTMATIVELK